jgi:hypothetical protein
MVAGFNSGTQIGFLFLILGLIGGVAGFDQSNQARKSSESAEELKAKVGEAKTEIDRNMRDLLINSFNGAAVKHQNRATFCYEVSGVCLVIAAIMLAIFAGRSLAALLARSRKYPAAT